MLNNFMALGQQAVTGSLWASTSKYISFAARFSGSIFLARMVSPKSFGMVAFTDSIIAMVFMLALGGETSAIIRCEKNIEEYTGTLLTLRIIVISFLGFVLVAVSYPIYKFYGEVAFLVFIAMATSQLPTQLSIIYNAHISKELLFKKQAIIEFSGTLISISIACLLAYTGYDIWALVAMLVSSNILTAGLRFVFVPRRIKPCFKPALLREFYHYGKFCFLCNTMDKLYRKLDSFSVGAFIGKQALGFYDRAYCLSEIFAILIWGGVGDVTDPLFSRLKNNRTRLGKAYELVNAFTFRLSILFYLWLGITLPDFIKIVYTAKWHPVVPILRLLIPYAVICGIKRINQSLHLNAGEAKNVAKSQAFELSIFLILLIPLMYFWKLKGVAVAVDMGAIVGIVFFLKYSSRLVTLHLKRVFAVPAISAVLTIGIFTATAEYITSDSIYLRFLIHSGLVVFSYTILSLVLEGNYIMELFIKILAQRKPNTQYLQFEPVEVCK
jgi:lipopolysaccharide exporter